MSTRASQTAERVSPAFRAVVSDDLSVSAVEAWAKSQGHAHERVLKGPLGLLIKTLEGWPTPERLIVDISGASEPLSDIAELADVCDVGTKVLVLGERNDISLYRELLALGVEEYLVKPVTAEAIARAFLESPKSANARPRRRDGHDANEEPKRGSIIAVVGARGGVGVSTIAGSLAWVLAGDCMASTALVDIDLQLGTGALMLDVEPGHGFRGVLENPERIDGLFLERAMVRVDDRLSVLCAEEPLSDTPVISGQAIDRLFDRLAACHAWVVIDVPRNAQSISRILPRADQVVVVTDRSLAGFRDTLRLTAFASEAAGQKPLHVVINRQQRARGEDLGGAVEKALGRPVSATIPFDAAAAAASAAKGQPMVAQGRGAAAMAMRRFGKQLAGADAQVRPAWHRWFGGR